MPQRHDAIPAPEPEWREASRSTATEPADRVLLQLMLCASGATLLLALATGLGA